MKKSNSISFTLEQIKKMPCAHLNEHLFEKVSNPTPLKKRSKYNNKKTEVDGILFDSQREANFYKKLLLLRKAGEIGLIECQVSYELNPNGEFSLKYLSDFEYFDKDGKKHVVDVKGFKTKEYRKKKRLMKKIYGITIEEV